MLRFQTLQPHQDYFTEIKEARVYYIYDHLWFETGIKDTLKHALEINGINLRDKFFIFDSYQYLEGYQGCSVYTNDFLIDTAADYLREFRDYKIDFNNKRFIFNCQMNKSRYPRVVASCWLKNNLYQKVDFIYSQPWDKIDGILPLIEKLANHQLEFDLLPSKWFDHLGNAPGDYLRGTTNERVFQTTLKDQMFDPCVFSVVMEPIEYELGTTITEKYINAVYGGNIPIVYGYKVYDVLSALGFDTFDDIIDTSSQHVIDPHERVIGMLESNKHLLSGNTDLIHDPKIQDRLNQNLRLVRDVETLYDRLIQLQDPKSLAAYKTLAQTMPILAIRSTRFHAAMTRKDQLTSI